MIILRWLTYLTFKSYLFLWIWTDLISLLCHIKKCVTTERQSHSGASHQIRKHERNSIISRSVYFYHGSSVTAVSLLQVAELLPPFGPACCILGPSSWWSSWAGSWPGVSVMSCTPRSPESWLTTWQAFIGVNMKKTESGSESSASACVFLWLDVEC